jgi:hypothetical protein
MIVGKGKLLPAIRHNMKSRCLFAFFDHSFAL